jgi:hypothetical protein
VVCGGAWPVASWCGSICAACAAAVQMQSTTTASKHTLSCHASQVELQRCWRVQCQCVRALSPAAPCCLLPAAACGPALLLLGSGQWSWVSGLSGVMCQWGRGIGKRTGRETNHTERWRGQVVVERMLSFVRQTEGLCFDKTEGMCFEKIAHDKCCHICTQSHACPQNTPPTTPASPQTHMHKHAAAHLCASLP